MKLMDKDALVAEIESKIEKYTKRGEESDAKRDGYGMYWGGVLSCLNEIRTLSDTLEVKEVDFEKELDKEWNKCEPTDEGMGLEIASIEHEQFDNIAKYFFELGLNASNPLTWEDIDWIVGEAVCRLTDDWETEQICKEVLKRFKAKKGE